MRKPSDMTAAIWLQRLYPGIAIGLVCVITVSAAQSRGSAPADPSQLCLSAARHSAHRHNVPFDVMHKVSLVETGRQTAAGMTPWPWAVHATAQGHWPATREGALAIIQSALNAGYRNIDIGCFQINYRWHSENFPSLDAMLDPAQNADYAAQLLQSHYQRLGSWTAAVGAYHSATPELAQRYIARFNTVATNSRSTAVPAPPLKGTQTTYALLQPGAGGALGSLVSQSLTQTPRPFVDTGSQHP